MRRTLTLLVLSLAVLAASAGFAGQDRKQPKPTLPTTTRSTKKPAGRPGHATASETALELRRLRAEIAIMRRQLQELYDYLDSQVHFRELAQERAREAKLLLPIVREISDESLTSLGCSSPTASLFAVITTDGGVRLYDAAGRVQRRFQRKDETVTAVAFSPNGKLLLAGTGAGSLLIWDLAAGDCEVVPAPEQRPSIGRVAWLAGTESIAWGATVSYYGKDGQRINTEQPSGAVLRRATGEVSWKYQSLIRNDFQGLSASPDGRRLAVLEIPGKPRAVFVLDGATGEIVSTLFHAPLSSGPLSAAVAPDGKTVAAGYAPSGIILWDSAKGELLRLLNGHTNWVVSLGFSRDGRLLISGGGDSTARVWSVATGKEIGRIRFPGESTYVESVGFSPDGAHVFALAEDGKLVIARAPGNPVRVP